MASEKYCHRSMDIDRLKSATERQRFFVFQEIADQPIGTVVVQKRDFLKCRFTIYSLWQGTARAGSGRHRDCRIRSIAIAGTSSTCTCRVPRSASWLNVSNGDCPVIVKLIKGRQEQPSLAQFRQHC